MQAYLKLFRSKWVFAALILSLVLLLQGCTLIGLGIGDLADGSPRKTVPPPKYADIKPGNKITVHIMNGDVLEGRFITASQKEKEEYRNHFAAFLSSTTEDAASFPLPGQNIFLVTKESKRTKAKFIGFDYQVTGKSFLCRIAYENENSGLDSTSFQSRFEGIENNSDDFWETELIVKLLSDERLPLLSQMQVDLGGITREIPLEDIAVITKHGKHIGAITGLVIGAAVDVVIILNNLEFETIE